MRFTTKNNLNYYLKIKRAEKIAERGGYKVLLREVEEELANFCGVTRDAIHSIKMNRAQPSLHVAMRISEYFGVPVEEIFKLVVINDKDDNKQKEN